MTQGTEIRVLLVEDNPGDARLVEILLSEVDSFGSFEITPAQRLDEALEHLDGPAFDVILLDLSLPDSSGLETVEVVRTRVPLTPVVVLTGQDDEESALRALQSGAEDYLVKGRGDSELMARSIRYAIERKKAEENLAHLKQYDPLTGLANRALFQDRLQQALARADRDDETVVLVLLDLDHFKAVNDVLGHAGGDELLREVASRIEGRVRESDTVARLGGDEFAIILEDMSDAQDAAPAAQDILDALSESLVLDGHEIPVTASIGIAVRPPSEGDRLLKDADAAVYRAKELGRNTYAFYAEEMNVRAFERLNLRNMLRQALKEEEFLLHYQPQVDLATGAIVGAEALVRWHQPDSGLVPPARFIPVLEDTGDIVGVGRWIMRTACHQNRAWQDSGVAPLRVAVNLSARQFSQGGLVSTVADVLEESGLDPSCLELEITESLLMEDLNASLQILGELQNVAEGLRVSIDDFGTGYSSLSYLKSFPIDLLKIDQSFVRDIPGDSDDAAITAAIVGLAHSLRLGVIAEGVETEEQATFLRERGCDEAQGYYFSRPLPAGEFAELLKAGGTLQGVSS
jgi:diguanylate cyclase (GGDEF)-like protein